MLFQTPYPNDGNVIVCDDDGTVLGNFVVEKFSGKKASIHTNLKAKFRKKGFGRQMYDEAEKLLQKQGLTLVPSPSLSPDSLRIWKARNPKLLEHHKARHSGQGAYLSREGLDIYYAD